MPTRVTAAATKVADEGPYPDLAVYRQPSLRRSFRWPAEAGQAAASLRVQGDSDCIRHASPKWALAESRMPAERSKRGSPRFRKRTVHLGLAIRRRIQASICERGHTLRKSARIHACGKQSKMSGTIQSRRETNWNVGLAGISGLSGSGGNWKSIFVVSRILLVSLHSNRKSRIQDGMKRTVQVNVKMTETDFNLLRKAAEKRWPDAEMTNSGIVLALARIAAREILKRGR